MSYGRDEEYLNIVRQLNDADKEIKRLNNLLLSFVAGMGICDHLGDVADDVSEVMRQMGKPYSEMEWDDLADLRRQLGVMGVKSLWGSEIE